MNIDLYSDRAKQAIQSAQSLALARRNQQLGPEHLLKVLLEEKDGLAALADPERRRPARGGRRRRREAAGQACRRSRAAAGQLYMKPEMASVFGAAEDGAKAADDAFVTTERLLIAIAKEGGEAAKALKDAGRDGRRPGGGRQGAAQGPHGRQRLGRGGLRRAEALRPRPHPGRARREARPGDRPRRGDPPHHPGAGPPHQEQSGADRRARRRQDRHRRGPGAAHRQRRRARVPEGQEADGARHGLADRRREVPRRVRGAAEGGAERGDRRRGLDHPLHRRDAHPGRRRQDARGRWTPPTC